MSSNGRRPNGYGRPPSNRIWERDRSHPPVYTRSNTSYNFRQSHKDRLDPVPPIWNQRARSLSPQQRYEPSEPTDEMSLVSPPWMTTAALNAMTSESVAAQVDERRTSVMKGWRCLRSWCLRTKINANFPKPLPVQELGIAAIQEEFDVILRVPRGYGQSTTWMIPILDEVTKDGRVPGRLHTLVVTPDEQTANETAAHLNLLIPRQKDKKLISPIWHWTPKSQQRNYQELHKLGGDILITTSFLLPSLLRDAPFEMESLRTIVFDDFDRFKEYGNREWIGKVHSYMGKNTQSIMIGGSSFSIEHAGRFLTNQHVVVDAKIVAEESEPTTTFVCARDDRIGELFQIINTVGETKAIIVFCNDEENVVQVYNLLRKKGVRHISFLFRQWQDNDEWIRRVTALREGHVDVLISTYENESLFCILIDTVDSIDVFYDLPPTLIMYENRLVRSGRMSRGDSITFIDECDLPRLDRLYEILAERPNATRDLRRIDYEFRRMNQLIEDNIVMTQEIERLQARIKANTRSRVDIEHAMVNLNNEALDKHSF